MHAQSGMHACKNISSWVGTFMHAQMKYTLANLHDLVPTLAVINIRKQHKPAKVGIKSCRFARVYFICACMNVPTQLELYLYAQLDIASKICVPVTDYY